jgi:hypothetical protein
MGDMKMGLLVPPLGRLQQTFTGAFEAFTAEKATTKRKGSAED